MVPVTIGLGSNLENPIQNVLDVAEVLRERFGPIRLSPLYRTSPMYVVDQPEYINAAAAFNVTGGPRQLLQSLKEIESDFGRVPSVRYGPRLIDLDLLTYGALTFVAMGIVVPHPKLKERLFVLRPLADISPQLEIPGQGIVSELADHSFEGQTVTYVEAHANF